MDTYMMWQCKTGAASLSQAAAHYERKYHQRPTICMAPPEMAIDPVEGIRIVRDRHVLPLFIWLGVEEVNQDGR